MINVEGLASKLGLCGYCGSIIDYSIIIDILIITINSNLRALDILNAPRNVFLFFFEISVTRHFSSTREMLSFTPTQSLTMALPLDTELWVK